MTTKCIYMHIKTLVTIKKVFKKMDTAKTTCLHDILKLSAFSEVLTSKYKHLLITVSINNYQKSALQKRVYLQITKMTTHGFSQYLHQNCYRLQ